MSCDHGVPFGELPGHGACLPRVAPLRLQGGESYGIGQVSMTSVPNGRQVPSSAMDAVVSAGGRFVHIGRGAKVVSGAEKKSFDRCGQLLGRMDQMLRTTRNEKNRVGHGACTPLD